MTHERDIDRLLDLWLADGPTEVPDRVVLDVADRIERQSQRPAWRFLRRPTIMTSSIRWAAVLVAVALMAVVGFAVLGRPSDSGIVGVSPARSSVATGAPQAQASPTPPASPQSSAPLGGGLILAYEKGSDGALDLYAIDAGTGERTLLGTLPARPFGLGGWSIQWAADRKHAMIGFGSGRQPTKLDDPTGAAQDIAFVCCPQTKVTVQSWDLSPQGDRLAGLLEVDDAIAIFDVETGSVRLLPLPSKMEVSGTAWSPDGTAIVVAGCRPCNDAANSNDPPTAIQHQRLLLVPVDGGPVRDLLEVTGVTFGSPAWSPNGSIISILYTACRPREQPPFCLAERTQIVLVKDGQRSVVADASDGPPVWSPDGRRIAFGDGGQIFVINADGSQKVKLVDGSQPRWSPDGQWLLFESPAAEGEVGDLWVVNADSGGRRPVGSYRAGAW